jgi:hypothetical protein
MVGRCTAAFDSYPNIIVTIVKLQAYFKMRSSRLDIGLAFGLYSKKVLVKFGRDGNPKITIIGNKKNERI